MKLLKRNVALTNDFYGEVNLSDPVLRYSGNPIVTPQMVNAAWENPALQVITVHNAGIALNNNNTTMLFRSHLRCGKCVFGIARSVDGLNQWSIFHKPSLLPATKKDLFAPGVDVGLLIELEKGGIADPRISQIGNEYAITYSAYHGQIRNRVRVCLATTSDFENFVRWGPLTDSDMSNVVIFPRPYSEGYAAIFQPKDVTIDDSGRIYSQFHIGFSDDWRRGPWKIIDKPIMRTELGQKSFSDKIVPGATPLETQDGWLSIFHGVRTTITGNLYVLDIALHDYYDWSKINMSSIPILFPSASDCRLPDNAYIHAPQVVSTCGALRYPNGTIVIYYGGNDTVMNCALSNEDVMAALCKQYGINNHAGDSHYLV